eukprot:1272234-Pleurochrysis_carterae.AAC.1
MFPYSTEAWLVLRGNLLAKWRSASRDARVEARAEDASSVASCGCAAAASQTTRSAKTWPRRRARSAGTTESCTIRGLLRSSQAIEDIIARASIISWAAVKLQGWWLMHGRRSLSCLLFALPPDRRNFDLRSPSTETLRALSICPWAQYSAALARQGGFQRAA